MIRKWKKMIRRFHGLHGFQKLWGGFSLCDLGASDKMILVTGHSCESNRYSNAYCLVNI